MYQVVLFSYHTFTERQIGGMYLVTVCIAYDGTLLSRERVFIEGSK